MKELYLGFVGMVMIMVWLTLSKDTNNVFLEILSILGWVTTWEAANIAILERTDLITTIRPFDMAISADYVFECIQES